MDVNDLKIHQDLQRQRLVEYSNIIKCGEINPLNEQRIHDVFWLARVHKTFFINIKSFFMRIYIYIYIYIYI